jgi:hypothetical protein
MRMRLAGLVLLAGCALPPLPGGGARLTIWRGPAGAAFTSGLYTVAPFDRAVLSWNATGAASFELQAGGAWHLMGNWGERPSSAKTSRVDVDTLVLPSPERSFRFRVTPAAGSVVTLVAVAHWKEEERAPFSARPSPAWGRVLDVPRRSQRVEAKDPGEICSPTSVSMVLEHHGIRKTTREVADGVFDHGEKIYGNWPFNTAYAHRVSGLEAFVAGGCGLEDLEAEIAAGRPVVLSHRWNKGDLDGAPIASSNGHLIVVAGFTEKGDAVVNDPAAPPESVRRVYARAQLHATWTRRASGVAYFFRPAR